MFLKNSTLYDKYLILPGIRRLVFRWKYNTEKLAGGFFWIFSFYNKKLFIFVSNLYNTAIPDLMQFHRRDEKIRIDSTLDWLNVIR